MKKRDTTPPSYFLLAALMLVTFTVSTSAQGSASSSAPNHLTNVVTNILPPPQSTRYLPQAQAASAMSNPSIETLKSGGNNPHVGQACTMPFSDVPSYGILFDSVDYMYCRRNVSGLDSTHYGPTDSVRRGEFTRIDVEAFGFPYYVPLQPTFPDIQPNNIFYVAIETAHYYHIVDGYADGKFHANDFINRGQMAKFVSNSEGYSDDTSGSVTFCDAIGNTFHDYIERLYLHRVDIGYDPGTNGCPPDKRSFLPNNNASRSDLTIDAYMGVTTPPTAGLYNRRSAIQYSDTWSDNDPGDNYFNPAYDYYGGQSQGGDCTNFVSQVMFAGLLPQQFVNYSDPDIQNWHYRIGLYGVSFSWRLADYLHQHMTFRSDRFQHVDTINQLRPGDVMQLITDPQSSLWDHSRSVVGYGTPPSNSPSHNRGMLVNQHNTDRYHVYWQYNIENYRADHITFWHINY